MTATLAIQPVRGLRDVRDYVIDCEHGTTTVTAINPRALSLTDAHMVRLALETHDAEQACGCTARLWRRYGEVAA